MLPDYPKIKNYLRGMLMLWTERQIPVVAPLLGQIRRHRQHEGKIGRIERLDGSQGTLDYPLSSFTLEMDRKDMRSFDMELIQTKLLELARAMANSQEKMMFEKISEAAGSVGNTIDARGEFKPEHILEMLEKVQMTFDSETLEPTGLVFVVHPSMAGAMMEKVKESENNPVFKAKHAAIMKKKLEEWRDRESDRKLVD
jgi:hypothetical protein